MNLFNHNKEYQERVINLLKIIAFLLVLIWISFLSFVSNVGAIDRVEYETYRDIVKDKHYLYYYNSYWNQQKHMLIVTDDDVYAQWYHYTDNNWGNMVVANTNTLDDVEVYIFNPNTYAWRKQSDYALDAQQTGETFVTPWKEFGDAPIGVWGVGTSAGYNNGEITFLDSNYKIYNIKDYNYAVIQDGYYYTFHLYDGSSFIKVVHEDDIYNSDFFTNEEKTLLFNGDRIAIDYYTIVYDSENDEYVHRKFDLEELGISWQPSTDLDVYINWTPPLPEIEKEIIIDEDRLKLRLTITDWQEEANYYIMLYTRNNNEISGDDYTFTYQKYLENNIYEFGVNYNDEILIKYGYFDENTGALIIVHTKYIHIDEFIEENYTEEEQQAFYNVGFNNTIYTNETDRIKAAIETFKVPINFITELIVYLYNSCNSYIKTFLVAMFSIVFICAIIKWLKE